MNLSKKKALAAKALKVGKNRIQFNIEGLSEIKEAITKEDIKILKQEGIITIKPIKGRQKIKKRKTRRGPGKIKKKVNNRKQTYVKITRKLRGYLKELKNRGVLDKELYWKLRKRVRMKDFKSKTSLKDYLKSLDLDLEKQIKSEGKHTVNAQKGKTSQVGKREEDQEGRREQVSENIAISKGLDVTKKKKEKKIKKEKKK